MNERFNQLHKKEKLKLDYVYEILQGEYCIDKEQIQRRLNYLDEKIEAAKQLKVKLDFLPKEEIENA